ncbi:MAG: GNAT family N-acetyltransferase [archaeon GB-1867-005]|nr:GNAT family N-acetyltransferase [Candidatus Culexmicrobium cathedralense]
MFIVERLKLEDFSKLRRISSSSTSSVVLMLEKRKSQFGVVFNLREELLDEPKTTLIEFGESDLNEIRRRIESKTGLQLVVKDYECFAGFLDLNLSNDDAIVNWLIVDDAYKDAGIELLLLRRALNYCRFHGARYVHVEVSNSNYSQYLFYRKFGFRIVGLKEFDESRKLSSNFVIHMVLELTSS